MLRPGAREGQTSNESSNRHVEFQVSHCILNLNVVKHSLRTADCAPSRRVARGRTCVCGRRVWLGGGRARLSAGARARETFRLASEIPDACPAHLTWRTPLVSGG